MDHAERGQQRSLYFPLSSGFSQPYGGLGRTSGHTNCGSPRAKNPQLGAEPVGLYDQYSDIPNLSFSDDISQLKEQLQKLGATQVLTYEELTEKSLRDDIKTWTGGKVSESYSVILIIFKTLIQDMRLALNCVGTHESTSAETEFHHELLGGKETTLMLKYLGKDAHLVSYGAMSKQPLSLPTSAFIFKNLTAHGFWQSRWYLEHSVQEREELMRSLAQLIKEDKARVLFPLGQTPLTFSQLKAPEHEIVSIGKQDDDNEATRQIREVFRRLAAGRYGKKILLRFED